MLSQRQINTFKPLIRLLDTNGDGTETKDAIGNYSAIATPFFIQPPIGQIFFINSFFIHLSDNGTFGQAVYGSMVGALTNGLAITIKTNGIVTTDILDGITIKTNDEFLHLSFSIDLISWAGALNSMVAGFNSLNFGTTMVLDGSKLQRLEVMCNDDFTALIDQHFIVNGYYQG